MLCNRITTPIAYTHSTIWRHLRRTPKPWGRIQAARLTCKRPSIFTSCPPMPSCIRRKSHTPSNRRPHHLTVKRALLFPDLDVGDRCATHMQVERVAMETLEASRSRWSNGLNCRAKRTTDTKARKWWARSLRSCLRGDATAHHSIFIWRQSQHIHHLFIAQWP